MSIFNQWKISPAFESRATSWSGGGVKWPPEGLRQRLNTLVLGKPELFASRTLIDSTQL